MDAIQICKINYGIHYLITVLFINMLADNSVYRKFEGWSECTDWDEHEFTSTNPYTGEVYVFPMKNIASIHMEVLGDDKD